MDGLGIVLGTIDSVAGMLFIMLVGLNPLHSVECRYTLDRKHLLVCRSYTKSLHDSPEWTG